MGLSPYPQPSPHHSRKKDAIITALLDTAVTGLSVSFLNPNYDETRSASNGVPRPVRVGVYSSLSCMPERTYGGKTKLEKMRSDKRTLHKRTYLIKKYGGIKRQKNHLDLSPYQYMLDQQNGVCAICGLKDKTGRALAIDHDHKTNLVRGLLCGSCNRGLGLFGDSYERLLEATKYLEKHGSEKNVQSEHRSK